MNIHKLLSNWGEGNSDAPDNEGSGAPAEPGDATWIHTFFDTAQWSAQGGDFVQAASATQSVDTIASYTWGSTAQMVTDVQGWLDDPTNNFGWIIIGDESGGASAKRFDSRHNGTNSLRPQLMVYWTEP